VIFVSGALMRDADYAGQRAKIPERRKSPTSRFSLIIKKS
jgi:hypothetical protein